MLPVPKHELPADKQANLKKATRYEWITILVMFATIPAMYASMGASQAMKTAWIDDILALIGPFGFLISIRIAQRTPNRKYPYGYHRAVTIAFLCGSLALFSMGLFLLYDGIRVLLMGERPTIGAVHVFGHTMWMGWIMVAVLVCSAVPPLILGRIKLPLADTLHDKTLFADAHMNSAEWKSAVAAMAGVLGIGVGWWWADAAAGCIISVDIIGDGFRNLRMAVTDLMNRRPMTVDETKPEALPEQLVNLFESYSWVQKAAVRLREEGHLFLGEAFIVTEPGAGSPQQLAELAATARKLDWRLHELVVMPVERILPAKENV